jgi:9-cis-beta-carotene 9',10'-cleaving dioxygenase
VPPLVVDPVRKQKQEEADEAFWDYQFLYRSQRNEVDSIPLTVVEGAVPADLAGVYFLCGPGILSDDYGSQVHPLDGHGYLRKFVIDGVNPVMYSAK